MEQPNMRSNTGYCWLIACVLFLLPLYSQASAWVSTQTRVGTQYQGTFAWPTEEMQGVLCTAASCSVAICHYSTAANAEICGNPSNALTRVIVSQGATAEMMRAAFVAKNGVSGSWGTVTPDPLRAVGSCFGVMYWQGSNDGNLTGRVIPGSYCGAVPPTPETCEVTGDVYINHGSLNQQSVDGAIKTEPLIINCTARTSVILTLVGGKSINLGQNGNLTSTLKVSGQDLSSGVTVTAAVGNTPFLIESTLHAPALPDAGTFSGSGVVIMSYL
ncbi:exported pilin protein [Yersinia bercovieri]|uniref:Exotoxin n=2 Tax=Yersinia bercovieri TaxID=634 RepID=A0A2G4U0W2_YERBE|nr:exotoxin [Yersinia bercovieri]QKJ07261.1 exotoxin [Yersinia bercovieri ATCC 43970]CFQ34951.1 exported pilin protein [Yersinia bercovieri]CNE62799.1 exported pilin protein [Yersinia bercovieri]CNH97345.1 exported pilin protein [Yersinia bercovieri]